MRSAVFADGVLDERVIARDRRRDGPGPGGGDRARGVRRERRDRRPARGRCSPQTAAEIGPAASYVAGDVREPADAERIVRACLERHGRLDVLVNNAGGQYFVPAEAIEPKGWRAVTRLNVGGTELMTPHRGRAGDAPGRRRHDRQRHALAAPRPGRHGPLERRPRRRRGLHARARARVGGRRHRRARDRRRPLRHRVAAQVPRAGLAGGRPHRPAAAARQGGGARLARRARRLAARPRALRLGHHARRRARQLVRPLAAAVAARRQRRRCPPRSAVRGPDSAPRARLSSGRSLAGEVLWLHRSLPSF